MEVKDFKLALALDLFPSYYESLLFQCYLWKLPENSFCCSPFSLTFSVPLKPFSIQGCPKFLFHLNYSLSMLWIFYWQVFAACCDIDQYISSFDFPPLWALRQTCVGSYAYWNNSSSLWISLHLAKQHFHFRLNYLKTAYLTNHVSLKHFSLFGCSLYVTHTLNFYFQFSLIISPILQWFHFALS